MKIKLPEPYRVNLHILSPVHVATEDEIDPFSYVISDETLYIVDLIRWMESYPDKEFLHKMMDSDNFAAVRSFIADNIDPEQFKIRSIPVSSKTLLDTYTRVIKEQDPKNQLLISGMTSNEANNIPFLPGSSIKGAIRTALANNFVEASGLRQGDRDNTKKYNETIFGRINDDHLMYLKIKDIALESYGTMVVEAQSYSLDDSKSLPPKGHKEVSSSLCQRGDNVVYPLQLSLNPFTLHNKTVDIPFIIESLYNFYVYKYVDEYNKFYTSDRAKDIRLSTAPMSLEVAKLKSNETLIRIGHFSHVECVTLDNIREPVTRRIKGRQLPWGTTRTLANGLYPFGWAKLEFLNIESKERNKTEWPFSVQELEKIVKDKKDVLVRTEQKILEEKKRHEDEIKKQALLEAMSPEERMIAEIEATTTPQNRVYEIYNKLDEFSPENKIKLANVLKTKWEAEDGKWNGKVTPKQKEKVNKIKSILVNS